MNIFKGLDLVDRVPEELWTEVRNIVHEVVTKMIPNKCKKAKRLIKEALQIAEKRSERQRRSPSKMVGGMKSAYHSQRYFNSE